MTLLAIGLPAVLAVGYFLRFVLAMLLLVAVSLLADLIPARQYGLFSPHPGTRVAPKRAKRGVTA